MANGRQKGAAFERLICKMLHDELGDYNWRRDLEQYRAGEHGDIICDEPSWPWMIECKRYASGGVSAAWWQQATTAARAADKYAALVYKFDRQPIKVRIHLAVLMQDENWDDGNWVDMEWPTFIYIARESWG